MASLRLLHEITKREAMRRREQVLHQVNNEGWRDNHVITRTDGPARHNSDRTAFSGQPNNAPKSETQQKMGSCVCASDINTWNDET